ncbi:hypothetical protein DL96DRAFT_1721377 [Flagelloscypha sp. PMI_526]|nr:hypothetical protein DL96DRAFT_1721377 [Flagelloscypha sp. PMI_526]
MTLLPLELYSNMLSFLEKEHTTLACCVLVNRSFGLMAQRLMWRTLRILVERSSLRHRYEKDTATSHFKEFLAFLQEDTSLPLLRFASIVLISIEALAATCVPEEITSIFTRLINLQFLELYGKGFSHIPPGILHPLLGPSTVYPKLDSLRLHGVTVPLIDILSARPGLRDLVLDRIRITTSSSHDKDSAAPHLATALRSLTVDTPIYFREEFPPSSQLLDVVQVAARQGSLKALHLLTPPRWYESSLLKICAASLTTFRFGWLLFYYFCNNEMTSQDLERITMSRFTSLETLHFEIMPIVRRRRMNPIPFLDWLTAEIQGVVISQADNRVFARILCDFKILGIAEAALYEIFGNTDGWRRLDAFLAKESVQITLRTRPEHVEILNSHRDIVFPLCSSNTVAQFEYEDIPKNTAYNAYTYTVEGFSLLAT